jgi:Sigma-70, region 4
VLILRDVLGFSGAEVADALETTPASVYSALQRAHRTIDDRLPDQSQQAALRLLGDARWRLIPPRASGQLAFGHYIWDAEAGGFRRHGVNVLAIRGARIHEITAFLAPTAFSHFDLPHRLVLSPR